MYILQPPEPYSFELSLKRLQDMPRQVVARVESGPVYVRALDQGGRLGLVRIHQQKGGLVVSMEGDLDPEVTLMQIRRAFALDLDLAGFYQQVGKFDPVMADLTQRYFGDRPISPCNLWESLAWAIIGQQITVSFAYTLKEALVRLGGRTFNGYPAFPGPERVAALRYEELQAEKYARRKAEYLIDIARAIAAGSLDLESLAALPFEEAVGGLVKLRGVGRWTAESLLMDAGRLEAFPADDVGIRNAVQRFYGLDHQPTPTEVRALGRAWSPYTSLACFYLWLGLRDSQDKKTPRCQR